MTAPPACSPQPPAPAGLRAVAAVEAGKGVLVLLAGFGVLALVHRDVYQIAEAIVQHFHLNPASRTPHIFLDTAQHLTNARLWLLSAAAGAYAGLRLAEAWGLWHARPWAEWLGALSSGVYVPIEVRDLVADPGVLHGALLAVNLAILLYLGLALGRRSRSAREN